MAVATTTHGIEGAVALVTGGARRLGAAIVECLHGAGMNVAIHYHSSSEAAEQLAARLDADRPGSVTIHGLELTDCAGLASLVADVARTHGGLHTLVNNASRFYPTSIPGTTEAQWDDLMGTNLKAPYFLAQAAAPWLAESGGCVVSLIDIYGLRPRSGYAAYSIAKAGLVAMTEALAKELAPAVRVNGVAPGAILPPSGDQGTGESEALPETPMERWGTEAEITAAVLWLVRDARYTTGTVVPVDGGRRLVGF